MPYIQTLILLFSVSYFHTYIKVCVIFRYLLFHSQEIYIYLILIVLLILRKYYKSKYMKVMGLSRSWISFSWKWLATMKWSWIYKSWHTLMNRLLRENSLKLKPQNVVIDCLLVSPNFFLPTNVASTNLYKLTFCISFLIHLSSHIIEVFCTFVHNVNVISFLYRHCE